MVAQHVVEVAVKNEMFDPEETIVAGEVRAHSLMTNPVMAFAFVATAESTGMGSSVNTGKGDTTTMISGTEVVVKSDGSLKKGGKQVIANQMYEEHVVNGNLSNQEFIRLLMTELNMSKAGSTTYAYNSSKLFNHKPTAKVTETVSKQQLANEIYKKHVIELNATKQQFIEVAMKELNTSKLGGQTYFYASKKHFA